jgi:hypothetical protein
MKLYRNLLLSVGLLVAMPAMRANCDEQKALEYRKLSWEQAALFTTDLVCSPVILSLGILTASRLLGYSIDMPLIVDVFTNVTLARGVASLIQYARDGKGILCDAHMNKIGLALVTAGLMELTVKHMQEGCAAQLANCFMI